LVLAAAVERFAVRRDSALTGLMGACWRSTAAQLKCKVPGPEVLCFGDSMVKYGVIPARLEALTGKGAYNLALHAGPVPATYFLLGRAIERDGRPAVVLIDSYEGFLESGTWCPAFTWADLLTARETAELAWTARDPDILTRTALRKLLHALKDRFEVRESILAALRGEEPWLRVHTLALERNWSLNAGAQVHQKTPTQGGSEGNLPEWPWVCDPVNQAYLERTFDLAARHGIAVLWLIPPVRPDVVAGPAARARGAAFMRFVREVQDRHAGVVVVDARSSGYDRSVFYDALHLDRDGAEAYTEALARVVNHYLAGPGSFPRWSELPPYRPAAHGAPVEDVAQSCQIVRSIRR
jgi:hypothetical protein